MGFIELIVDSFRAGGVKRLAADSPGSAGCEISEQVPRPSRSGISLQTARLASWREKQTRRPLQGGSRAEVRRFGPLRKSSMLPEKDDKKRPQQAVHLSSPPDWG
jgi:hypothetical protein